MGVHHLSQRVKAARAPTCKAAPDSHRQIQSRRSTFSLSSIPQRTKAESASITQFIAINKYFVIVEIQLFLDVYKYLHSLLISENIYCNYVSVRVCPLKISVIRDIHKYL